MTGKELTKFNFQGDNLEVIKDNETLWISVRRVCEALGIDSKSQMKKLQEKEWACVVIITSHDASGRKQGIFMIDLDSLPMWLATINANKVASHVRLKLEAYQKEASKVLRKLFFETNNIEDIKRHNLVIKYMNVLSKRNLPDNIRRVAEHELSALTSASIGTYENSDEKGLVWDDRLVISVDSFLKDNGLLDSEIKKYSNIFSKILKKLYKKKHGYDTDIYTLADKDLFILAFKDFIKDRMDFAEKLERRLTVAN
jgi:hypothetical protein